MLETQRRAGESRDLGSEQRDESREHQIRLKLAGTLTGPHRLLCHWSVGLPTPTLFLTFLHQDPNPWRLRNGSVGKFAQRENQSSGSDTHIKNKQQGEPVTPGWGVRNGRQIDALDRTLWPDNLAEIASS